MKIIKTLIIIAAVLFGLFYVAHIVGAEAAPKTCPAGSYDIGISKDGDPICKLEPTGCPYGDSIPMTECDKFKDQQKEIFPTTTEPVDAPLVQSSTIETPVTSPVDYPSEEFQGK